MPIDIKVFLDDGARLPEYKHPGDAGADLRANEDKIIPANSRGIVDTGVHIQPPEGWYTRVVPRSGLALKKGITVLNTPGTVDEQYRDSIKVILMNTSDNDFVVSKGDRIAQLILEKLNVMKFEKVTALDESERGNNGFGSTGIK